MAASLEQVERLLATGRIGPVREGVPREGRRPALDDAGRRPGLGDGTVAELALDISDRKAAEQGRREVEER